MCAASNKRERVQKHDFVIKTQLSGEGPWKACSVQSAQIEFKILGEARNSIAQEPPGDSPQTWIRKQFCVFISSQTGATAVHIFISNNNNNKKNQDTEGTRAIKNLQKPMYVPPLYYGHKNICDKDGGICTHWPLGSSTKQKQKKKKLKHVELRWTCFVAEPSQSYTYMLCKYIASTNDHEVCSNIKEAACATQKNQTVSKLSGHFRANLHFKLAMLRHWDKGFLGWKINGAKMVSHYGAFLLGAKRILAPIIMPSITQKACAAEPHDWLALLAWHC